jgi:hypothetical protein
MSIKHFRICFLLGILNLPNAFGIQELQLIVIGMFLLVAFINMDKLKKLVNNTPRDSFILVAFLYLSALIISLLRAEELSVLRVLSLSSFVLFLFAFLANLPMQDFINDPVKTFKTNFSDPFIWYFSINLTSWLFNIQTISKQSSEVLIGKGVILANFGIYIDRVNFLFSSGINSYAVILGAIMTFQLAYCAVYSKVALLDYVYLVVILVSLLLVDSRSGIIYPSIIIITTLFLWKMNLTKWISFSPILYFIVPVIFIFLLPELADFEFVQDISRSSSDLFTLNGRLYIWLLTLNEFASFDWIHLFGYGFNGHFVSGASIRWGTLFTSWENSDSMHPHNVIFSTLYDIGYAGVALFLFLFFKTANSLKKITGKIGKTGVVFTSFFIYLILISCSETFIGLYYLNAINIFFTFIFFIVLLNINLNLNE